MPEQLNALAGKVEALEADMDAVKALTKAYLAALPVDGKNPQSPDLIRLYGQGYRAKRGSALWRLGDLVMDIRAAKKITPEDQEKLKALEDEINAGL